jgi:aminoglycoside phosphotransferase (APT) family kinase protein
MNIEISLPLVTDLISEQFPQWAHLPIRPVKQSGWDNRTYHLGETMLIRLPSEEGYAAQVPKEQKWLPILSKYLPVSIPKPLALGKPSKDYPWNWSIYSWLEGEHPEQLLKQPHHLEIFARDIALFLNELQKIDSDKGPLSGEHNCYRGAHPSIYAQETKDALTQLKDFSFADLIFDSDKANYVWEKAIKSSWNRKPVWIHGDFSTGNILVKENKLTAVIDFGCMGVGDPACDLVIAWTFLTQDARKVFKSHLSSNIDADTWDRARGWCLWKALITLLPLKDKTCEEALKIQNIIKDILQNP